MFQFPAFVKQVSSSKRTLWIALAVLFFLVAALTIIAFVSGRAEAEKQAQNLVVSPDFRGELSLPNPAEPASKNRSAPIEVEKQAQSPVASLDLQPKSSLNSPTTHAASENDITLFEAQGQVVHLVVSPSFPVKLDPLDPSVRPALVKLLNERLSTNNTRVEALMKGKTRLAGPEITEGCRPSVKFLVLHANINGHAEPVLGYCQLTKDQAWFFEGQRLNPFYANADIAPMFVATAGVLAGIILTIVVLLGEFNLNSRLTAIEVALVKFSEGDLDTRLPLGPQPDEISRIAIQVNFVLARVQGLMLGLRSLGDQVAHELKGGVGRIQRRLEAAEIDGADYPEILARLDACQSEARSVLAAVDSILTLSAIKSNSDRNFKYVNLHSIAVKMLDLMEIVAEDKNQTVAKDLLDANILGDESLLSQLFANLFENAVKYTPERGTIRISVLTESGTAILSVSDTGPGIPASMRNEVFAPGKRLVRDRAKPGYGYGLAICMAIVEHHGGALSIVDSPTGATFQVRFPSI